MVLFLIVFRVTLHHRESELNRSDGEKEGKVDASVQRGTSKKERKKIKKNPGDDNPRSMETATRVFRVTFHRKESELNRSEEEREEKDDASVQLATGKEEKQESNKGKSRWR